MNNETNKELIDKLRTLSVGYTTETPFGVVYASAVRWENTDHGTPCTDCTLKKARQSAEKKQCPYIGACFGHKRPDKLSVIFRRAKQ